MIDSGLKARLRNKYGDEQVLVTNFVSTKKIQDKFYPTPIKEITPLVRKSKFILRYDAEYNTALVQLIPYILLVDKKKSAIYVTHRIAGEERLRDSIALGCGGHISPEDVGGDLLYRSARREMNEEIQVSPWDDEFNYLGTVRDLSSSTPDHLGCVLYLTIKKNAKVKETDKLSGEWMTFEELTKNYGKFESWARHILDSMLLAGGIAPWLER